MIDAKDSGKLTWEFSGIVSKIVRMQGHSCFQRFLVTVVHIIFRVGGIYRSGDFREYVKNCKGARALISLSEFKDFLGIAFQ